LPSLSSVVKMQIVTTFSRPMTKSEWTAHEAQFLKPEFFNLVSEMYQAGEMLHNKDEFLGDSVRWDVEFINMAAFKKWQGEVARRGLIDDDEYKRFGFKIETTIS
jgi:hypothetical protein